MSKKQNVSETKSVEELSVPDSSDVSLQTPPNISIKEDVKDNIQPETLDHEDKLKKDNPVQKTIVINQPNKSQYINAIIFLGLLIVGNFIVQYVYNLAHGLPLQNLLLQPETTWTFTFIGENPNPSSIGMEILVWTFTGVSARLAYSTTKSVSRKKFSLLKNILLWISTALFTWGIGVALILSLSVISLSVAGIELTLANASLEAIIAISFVLGFYHESAIKFLGSVREKLVWGVDSDDNLEDGNDIL